MSKHPMVLRVEIEAYASALSRHLGRVPVYVDQRAGSSTVTACDPKRDLLLVARCDWPLTKIEAALEDVAASIESGRWSDEDSDLEEVPVIPWIAAVAYKSSERKPGLWIDAFASRPSTGEVLGALYDEFVSTGELSGISLEEFIRVGNPNVVVVSPEDALGFLAKKVEP